jgi:hypothetical protein
MPQLAERQNSLSRRAVLLSIGWKWGHPIVIKKHHREKDAVVLSPRPTNATHTEVRFYQGDELKVQKSI